MTTKLLYLVTEAVRLGREISKRPERLKELKAQLVEAACECEDELVPTDGGGLRWTAKGDDGCIARVNFPHGGEDRNDEILRASFASSLSDFRATCERIVCEDGKKIVRGVRRLAFW